MLGPIFNSLGNLLGEDVPQQPGMEPDPIEFQPGFLFDTSASWVLFFRRLLLPKYDVAKVPCEALCDNPACETCHKSEVEPPPPEPEPPKPKKKKGKRCKIKS